MNSKNRKRKHKSVHDQKLKKSAFTTNIYSLVCIQLFSFVSMPIFPCSVQALISMPGFFFTAKL